MQRFLYIVLFFFFLGTIANSQSELIVEPGPPGVLNAAIDGDTTATGERADPDRVYVLRRGVPYLLTASLEYSGYHLRIKADEGAGARPFLMVDAGGGSVSNMIRLNGTGTSLTLDGLHLSGQDILGAYSNRIIRINSDDSEIVVNDCLLEEAGQSAFRVQGDNPKIFVTNSVVRNIGRPSNPDNGRVFDNRGVPIDTLWVENSIVYNISSRVYRDGSGDALNWAKFNQNTFWGSGQHGFTFGNIKDLEFTNNITYNALFLGRLAEDQDTLETATYWVMIDTFDAAVNTIKIANNNWHLESGIGSAYPITEPDGRVRVAVNTNFTFGINVQAANSAAGNTATNLDETLTFENAPVLPLQFITAHAQDTTAGSEIPTAEPWDFSNLEKDTDLSAIGTGTIDRYRQVHDFSYSSTSLSYSWGSEGQPIGADPSLITETPDIFVENGILYYPNPVQDRLVLQNLEDAGLDRIEVFNLMGQRILQVPANGDAVVELYLGKLQSGTYLLSVVDENGRISSRKIVKQ